MNNMLLICFHLFLFIYYISLMKYIYINYELFMFLLAPSISSEFMKLMSTVSGSKGGMVMEVIQIPGAQRSLERLADLLAKIQKALGEYLEKERSSFPRFYFVGNEDLLDIIGNSKNVERLQKHFQNMFAGVHSVVLNVDQTEVIGLCSREAEEVVLKTSVKIKDVKINTWLTKLEEEMKLTLAKLLSEAVDELEHFRTHAFNLTSYFAWLDKYQAQLVVLSSQVFWSHSVEAALKAIETSGGKDLSLLKGVLDQIDATLTGLADAVLLHQPPIRRRKLEHMITEMVHQRDVTREVYIIILRY
jgi:dynein heavy chain 1